MRGAFSIKAEHCDYTSQVDPLCVITMPNGTTIAASGWVNQWDEEQVRELAMDQKRPQ